MEDVEYVKSVLAGDYSAEHPHEIPYPDLEHVIAGNSFDYPAGTVDGETPNGSKSREGNDYYWFQHGGKSILTHRFIAAVTLGRWIPRDFDVDHKNHNPSDNRPENLRIVTRRDNAGNRRKALLSELADLSAVSQALTERKSLIDHEPEPEPITEYNSDDATSGISFGGHIPRPKYTGETKPAKYGGTWHKTDLGSWHLLFDRPGKG